MSSPVLIEQLDCAINVMLYDADAAISSVDSSVAELLAIAAELRTLPRPEFRARLRDDLRTSCHRTTGLGGQAHRRKLCRNPQFVPQGRHPESATAVFRR